MGQLSWHVCTPASFESCIHPPTPLHAACCISSQPATEALLGLPCCEQALPTVPAAVILCCGRQRRAPGRSRRTDRGESFWKLSSVAFLFFWMPARKRKRKPTLKAAELAVASSGGASAQGRASKTPAGLSVPSKIPGFTTKMRGTPQDSGAVVQALLHRTPTTSPPWPVRCLRLRRTVGTSVQLNVRAWCPNQNCASFHQHRSATSRGCSRRRRGSCSPRWPTRDWRRYATHARASTWHGKVPPASSRCVPCVVGVGGRRRQR
jgi:hypothetical protein